MNAMQEAYKNTDHKEEYHRIRELMGNKKNHSLLFKMIMIGWIYSPQEHKYLYKKLFSELTIIDSFIKTRS